MHSGEVFAGYVIERELGRGGMGSVYLAQHPRLPRKTALKLLNQEMFSDNEIRARFVREADLVAQLDHPNIVTVYDRGTEGEQLWISMQYIDGVNATAVNPGSLPPMRAAQIIGETAKALDYAHAQGVLHRDVKPANILLARSSGKTGAGLERVYLTDFGIARLRDDTGHLTQTGTVTATLAYASPEQLTGATLDGRSDQYALACTLFQLLTGAVPFEGTSPAAVIRGHLQQPPPPASPLRPELPRAIDAVLARALAKRPQERFRSCAEFAAAAERALTAPPVPPRPPTPARPQPVVQPPRQPTPNRPQPVVQQPVPPRPPTPSAGRPLVPPPNQGPAYQNPNPATPTPAYQGPQSSGQAPVYPNPQSSAANPVQPGQQPPPVNPAFVKQQSSSANPAYAGPQPPSVNPSFKGPQSGTANPVYPNQQSSPVNPVVPGPQSPQPTPAYAPRPAYNPPAAPSNFRPPQRRSTPVGWIVFVVTAVIVVAIVAIALIAKANKSLPDPGAPSAPTTVALAQVFPASDLLGHS
ncbi:serine/threonine-protein kinase [Nocardia huaxiensis]|uniref:serine/threonine-protein kinase n=1 Tax=Nocardia huaxiensis TaxID=2755382 RepID=UPI001E36412B|nr:serine/threonine-protein kinase [Nocardia huaxiensis]UFS93356.1 protein kinase [Nocardia huaxiensis]